MSKEAEKFIEKYTTKDQNDWLVEKKDIIARFMESYHTEQLTLTDVSQQRELLNQYNEFINTQYSYNDLSENDTIDFFEWFNCG